MSRSTIPWSRVIAEGTAIVLSILLAFAIDAWWDRRSELAEEAVFLVTLRQEMEAARSDLERGIEQQKRVRDAGGRWTFVTRLTPIDTIRSAVSDLLFWYTPELELPSVRSALGTGAVSRLRSPGLGAWIADWATVSQDTFEEAEAVRSWVHAEVYPFFVREKISVTPVFRSNGIPLSDRVPETELLRLVGDAGFESLVNFSSLLNDSFLGEAKIALALLEEGITLVDEALDQ